MKTYPAKVCHICGREWQPKNRYQSTRNLTCGPECNRALISQRRSGTTIPSRQRRVTVNCAACGIAFETFPRTLKRVKNPTCSRHCNGILRSRELVKHSANGKGKKRPGKGLAGPDNPAWKGGVMTRRPKGNYIGPVYVRCPEHLTSMARADGYVMEHRLVMATITGYPLLRTEVVHHLDHMPRHNDPHNLELWPSNSSHKLAEHGRLAPGAACRWSPKGSEQP